MIMRKIILFVALVLLASNAIAQKKTYLVFELIKVTPDKESDFTKVESFWEKMNEQRIKSGEILGWELWRMRDINLEYQYVMVQVFNDPAKMLHKADDAAFLTLAKKAFPAATDKDLLLSRNALIYNKDLSETFYIEQIDQTKGRFDLSIGAVMGINLMKVNPENYAKYENAESKIFKQEWQSRVNEGRLGAWSLLKVIPAKENGSESEISYVSLDKFKDFNQLYGSSNEFKTIRNQADQIAWQDALNAREIHSYEAVLIKKATSGL